MSEVGTQQWSMPMGSGSTRGCLDGKTILVTGGTGSFGQQFVDVVLRTRHPEAIRIYSRDELKQQEMQRRFPDKRLRFLIGDVRDKERLNRAMRGVEIVVHAAALKQVPACEYNPFEAVKTNVLGAANVIDAAIDCGVERVLAISTDKAVNPVNLYGATKLCAEKLFTQGNFYSDGGKTRLSCARWARGGAPSPLDLPVLDHLIRTYAIRSVFGCGRGAEAATQYCAERSLCARHVTPDWRSGPYRADRTFELVWCGEETQSIKPRYLRHLIETLTHHAERWLVMTYPLPRTQDAEPPDFQQDWYWVQLITERGFYFDPSLTLTLRNLAQHRDFKKAGLAFERTSRARWASDGHA